MEHTKEVLLLSPEEIRPNPFQPRRTFDPESLEEMAASIRRCGILQPLTVRRRENGWELIAGERRLRGARLAGLDRVPCLEVRAGEEDSALLALVENLQRRDLHYFEESESIGAYIRSANITQEEAAGRLGMSPSALANKLRLLRLEPACREILVQNGLTERHARCLLRLEDPEDRLDAARSIAQGRLNVAQSERLVEKKLSEEQKTPPAGRRTFIIKDVRLFLNSVDRGLRLIREAGVDASCGRSDTEDEILLTIRIPKRRPS